MQRATVTSLATQKQSPAPCSRWNAAPPACKAAFAQHGDEDRNRVHSVHTAERVD